MREKDRVLRRRRQRRNKRLKVRNQEEIAAKVERPAGSRRTTKKAAPEAAPAPSGEGAPAEAPAPEKKKPAARKAAAKAPEVVQESGGAPQGGEGEGA